MGNKEIAGQSTDSGDEKHRTDDTPRPDRKTSPLAAEGIAEQDPATPLTDFSNITFSVAHVQQDADPELLNELLNRTDAAAANNRHIEMDEVFKNPEIKLRYDQLLLNLRVEQDANAVHFYLADNNDFDVVATLGTANNALRSNEEYPTVQMTFIPDGTSETILHGVTNGLTIGQVDAVVTDYLHYSVFLETCKQMMVEEQDDQ